MARSRSPLLLACALSWRLVPAIALLPLMEPSAASAQPADADADAAARQAFEAGQDAYDRGRFTEALAHFERAFGLSPRPKLLFNIARAADSDLQSERAISAYESYLLAFPKAENREFVEGRLSKLRELVRQQRTPAPAPLAAPAAAPPPPPEAPPPAAPPPPVEPVAPPGEPVAEPAPLPAPYVSGAPAPVQAPAQPARSIGSFRMYVGGRLDVAGSADVLDEDGEPTDDSYDARATPGLQVGLGGAWRFFGIGGELRLSWFGIEDDPAGRFRALDVVVKPKVGYQLRSKPLEFYATLPVGLSIPMGDEEEVYDPLSGMWLEQNYTIGATVGFLVGASYFFTKHVGLNMELGWMGHFFGYKVGDDLYGGSGNVSFAQFSLLNVNLMFAF